MYENSIIYCTFIFNGAIYFFASYVKNTGAIPQGTSPPKPPRAHELKLLMKNIKATLANHNIAGIIIYTLLSLYPPELYNIYSGLIAMID